MAPSNSTAVDRIGMGGPRRAPHAHHASRSGEAVSLRGRSSAILAIFRIALAMEFVGHGAFGIKTKAAWVPYFGVFGIPEAWAWMLMPLVGALDITLGLLTLVLPLRAVLVHMTCWGLMTATLRPLAGEGVWETLERGYNYGVPFAFLLLAGLPTARGDWLSRIEFAWTAERRRAAAFALRGAIGLCLIGHGGIALFMHTRWTAHLEVLGVSHANALATLHVAGWFELALGVAVLVAPLTPLLVIAGLWKIGTEALRIPAGEPNWEFIERGGAYAAPLLLILLQRWPRTGAAR
jgi:hypothetical protein